MGINLKDHITKENIKLSRSEIKAFLLKFFDDKQTQDKTEGNKKSPLT